MAKYAVDVSVVLKHALRFTLRRVPSVKANGKGSAAVGDSSQRLLGASSTISTALSSIDKYSNDARAQGLSAIVVASSTSPRDLLALMVGGSVHGPATYAIPTDLLLRPAVSEFSATVPPDAQKALLASHTASISGSSSSSSGRHDGDVEDDGLLRLVVPSDISASGRCAAHAFVNSYAVSAKDIAASSLRPSELTREEFEQRHQLSEAVTSCSPIGSDRTSYRPEHGSEVLAICQHGAALAAAGCASDLEEWVQRTSVNPATLRCGEEQATLLHYAASAPACTKSNPSSAAVRDTVRLLVHTYGVPIEATTRNGATALHWAAGHGNAEAVTALLEAGADPLSRTWTWDRSVFGRGSGQTPLHWAAESGHREVTELLLHHHPDTTTGGEMPILMAAVPDERGATPADVAGKNLQWDMHAALRELEETEFVLVDVERI